MPLLLKEIKEKNDKAYSSGQITRERASDDMVFYYVTHWDDALIADFPGEYRGQFDVLKKAGRDILANLAANPIQIDFFPKDEKRQDAADFADGKYRADCNHNTSIEAFTNAKTEAVVCGMGAHVLFTEEEMDRAGNTKQVIRRRPQFEANNTAYCDPNAKLLDRSDAKYWSLLTAYSEEGYKLLVSELTGEDLDDVTIDTGSFSHPEESYSFPWIGGEGKKIYVANFYAKEKVKVKIITVETPMGDTQVLRAGETEDIYDEMLLGGYEVLDEKIIEQDEVRLYICSGAEILNGDEDAESGERVGEVIPGPNIPVVPNYGEHAWIEGEAHYEGVTRLAKDPQRLRNFVMSYLATIAGQSPRPKPVFTRAQIAGYEHMYEENGADNNFPFYLINDRDEQGNLLNPGPGLMPEQQIPQSLVALEQLTRQAVADVANPGLAQDVADPDLSGKAVLALQARIDMQAMVYQEHSKHSLRYDGVVWTGMAAEIMDVPSEEIIELPDGTRQSVKTQEQIMDRETGEWTVLNDLSGAEFEVFSKIGSSYSSQRDQTIDSLQEAIQAEIPGSPMHRILSLKRLMLMDGVDVEDVRKYARKELVMMGVNEAETDEEKQWLAEKAQQGEQPTAEMVLAQGELAKGQAAQMDAETKRMTAQSNFQSDQVSQLIDKFKAQTDRFEAQIKAQESGAKIGKTEAEKFGQQIDNRTKVRELQNPKNMSRDELMQSIMAG